MTDLDLFLDRCFVVEETQGGAWGVFLFLPSVPVAGDSIQDGDLFFACGKTDECSAQVDTDGAKYPAFKTFLDEPACTREEAEATREAMKESVRGLVRLIKRRKARAKHKKARVKP